MPTQQAAGTFDVKLTPQSAAPDAVPARMSLDKHFHGDLEAVSKGEMLSAAGAVKGSAGYVAIERVTGALHGRTGSFVPQHFGIMDRGEPQLTITVIPDSGAGDLTGLSGKMDIQIDAGKHSYTFTYSLSPSAAASRHR